MTKPQMQTLIDAQADEIRILRELVGEAAANVRKLEETNAALARCLKKSVSEEVSITHRKQ